MSAGDRTFATSASWRGRQRGWTTPLRPWRNAQSRQSFTSADRSRGA